MTELIKQYNHNLSEKIKAKTLSESELWYQKGVSENKKKENQTFIEWISFVGR